MSSIEISQKMWSTLIAQSPQHQSGMEATLHLSTLRIKEDMRRLSVFLETSPQAYMTYISWFPFNFSDHLSPLSLLAPFQTSTVWVSFTTRPLVIHYFTSLIHFYVFSCHLYFDESQILISCQLTFMQQYFLIYPQGAFI